MCSIGRIAVARGLASCGRCSPGRINNDPYATDAGLHDAGSDCAPCPSGKFSSADGSSCIVCIEGTYVFNMSSCELCTAGKYAPTAVNDDCITCPAMHVCSSGWCGLTSCVFGNVQEDVYESWAGWNKSRALGMALGA